MSDNIKIRMCGNCVHFDEGKDLCILHKVETTEDKLSCSYHYYYEEAQENFERRKNNEK